MAHPTPRRFTRVNFRQPIRLDFGKRRYKDNIVRDISLSGVYIAGHFEEKEGDTCIIELSQSGVDMPVDLQATGSVVRVDEGGIAIEFISMDHDSLLSLQTILLYEAEDPTLLGSEFVKNISFEVVEVEE